MNLRDITAGVVASVNPRQRLQLQRSTGSTTGADGSRTPSYAPAVFVFGQVQSLTFRDLQQIEGLNLQGTRRAIYLDGHSDGAVRVSAKGGDLITDQQGNIWLVAIELEHWPGWSKVAVTLQNGA